MTYRNYFYERWNIEAVFLTAKYGYVNRWRCLNFLKIVPKITFFLLWDFPLKLSFHSCLRHSNVVSIWVEECYQSSDETCGDTKSEIRPSQLLCSTGHIWAGIFVSKFGHYSMRWLDKAYKILEQQLLISWYHKRYKINFKINDKFPSPAGAEIHSNSDVNDKSLVWSALSALIGL